MFVCEASDGDTGTCGCCGYILIALSWILIILTFPFSLMLCMKVNFPADYVTDGVDCRLNSD